MFVLCQLNNYRDSLPGGRHPLPLRPWRPLRLTGVALESARMVKGWVLEVRPWFDWQKGCSTSPTGTGTATGTPYHIIGKSVNTVCSGFRFISAILSWWFFIWQPGSYRMIFLYPLYTLHIPFPSDILRQALSNDCATIAKGVQSEDAHLLETRVRSSRFAAHRNTTAVTPSPAVTHFPRD